MIIQHVLKGMGGISQVEAEQAFEGGILCNWWRKVGTLPETEVKDRLTSRNLAWHQNNYDRPDPLEGGEPFALHSPFISTTAGSIQRDPTLKRHILRSALETALEFATDFWTRDAYVYYCYLFVLGRPSIPHRAFAEELRDVHLYTDFSPFQPEGEITAKIVIPATQIEKLEFFPIADLSTALASGHHPTPASVSINPHFEPPEHVANVRSYLS